MHRQSQTSHRPSLHFSPVPGTPQQLSSDFWCSQQTAVKDCSIPPCIPANTFWSLRLACNGDQSTLCGTNVHYEGHIWQPALSESMQQSSRVCRDHTLMCGPALDLPSSRKWTMSFRDEGNYTESNIALNNGHVHNAAVLMRENTLDQHVLDSMQQNGSCWSIGRLLGH